MAHFCCVFLSHINLMHEFHWINVAQAANIHLIRLAKLDKHMLLNRCGKYLR